MFRSKLLVFFLFLSLAAALFLPLFAFGYLYPAIDRLLISDAQLHAKRIANHFSMYFDIPDENLTREHITFDLVDEISEVIENFSLEKVRVFSATGEILYSSDPEDIGTMNNRDYFESLVIRGKNFTKIVTKDTRSLEGRVLTSDVVETYIPIWGNDMVVGAFELYYDISDIKALFSDLIRRSAMIIYSVTFVILSAFLVSLFKLSKNMTLRERAEKELVRHREEMELLVQRRTAELTATNIQLQEDIRRRQDAEKDLQLSEEKYRSLVEMAGDPIFIIDARTRIISDVNRKAKELIGRDADEIIGLQLTELQPKGEPDLLEFLLGYQGDANISGGRIFHLRHKSGRRVPVEVSSSFLDFGGYKMIQGIFRDITQRLQVEEELQKNEKLKTASLLAGGIAHDFNNLLTAVLGNVSLAKMESRDDARLQKRLADTEKAIGRARELTQQLLTFAKGGKPDKKTVALGRIIEEAATFVLRGSKVKCDCTLSNDLWNADVDPGQINQVINNLVINASHAMPEGGNCHVRAENVTLTKADNLLLSPGRYIKIEVEDEGHGIPRKQLARIFDPFFTTKEKGSGLGLSSAYSIITKHGGGMTVESEFGKGATFIIYLPASDAEPEKEIQRKEEDLTGQGRILIMDDEEFVRDAVASLLEYLGYETETVGEGKSALKKYREALENGQRFDAVIMDLTVPGGMGGKDAVLELKKIDPDAKTIVSSGYHTDPILANHREYGFDGVVPKPYQLEELGLVVKKVLAQ
jgi:PAS domain S-box-containing protein